MKNFSELINFIRNHYLKPSGIIPLHAPTFTSRDKELVLDAIDSTFVSSIGSYVDRFETMLTDFTGAKRAVATVNGTSALQVALRLVGVSSNDEVITQPLTFVATANAIVHQGAHPVFVDVDLDTMGLSPDALEAWLLNNAEVRTEDAATSSSTRFQSFNKQTGRRIAAIVPMHTFGHPCRILRIIEVAKKWFVPVVEDAAEALGSWREGTHCGVFGDVGVLSFNGNKTITCGGGGALLTNDESLADHAKHLTTTAKNSHQWEFTHDEVAYNFRMPNLNAALACGQMERLSHILKEKRDLARAYKEFFKNRPWATFCKEPPKTKSNYWLCSVALSNEISKNDFLQVFNSAGIMSRPVWKLMTELPMYSRCLKGPLENAKWLRNRVVNLPSGVRSSG